VGGLDRASKLVRSKLTYEPTGVGKIGPLQYATEGKEGDDENFSSSVSFSRWDKSPKLVGQTLELVAHLSHQLYS